MNQEIRTAIISVFSSGLTAVIMGLFQERTEIMKMRHSNQSRLVENQIEKLMRAQELVIEIGSFVIECTKYEEPALHISKTDDEALKRKRAEFFILSTCIIDETVKSEIEQFNNTIDDIIYPENKISQAYKMYKFNKGIESLQTQIHNVYMTYLTENRIYNNI